MFRVLASCSRGGFEKNDKTFQQTKNVDKSFGPEKWKWGQKIY